MSYKFSERLVSYKVERDRKTSNILIYIHHVHKRKSSVGVAVPAELTDIFIIKLIGDTAAKGTA